MTDIQYKFFNDASGEPQVWEYTSYEAFRSDEAAWKHYKNPDHFRMVTGRTIWTFSRRLLTKDKDLAAKVERAERAFAACPIGNFAPTSPEMLRLLNDRQGTIKLVVGPNRTCKTTTAVVDAVLDGIPGDPKWPIFASYGVRLRPWRKPTRAQPFKIAFASYKWRNVEETIWPMVRQWLPAWELGPYAIGYVGKGKKEFNAERTHMIRLRCGTELWFYCYEQDQDVFESAKVNIWVWDEQGTEAKFNGANARTRTLNGRHLFSLTPHKVEGRPDTGAGSWINRLWDGEITAGHKVGRFNTTVDEVPDWVMTEEMKHAAYVEWVVEPKGPPVNRKKLAEGEARYWGRWHRTAGLVYDEWDRKVHLIDPPEIPEDATRYRAIDHGMHAPTACLWIATWFVDNRQVYVVYRAYSATDRTISENVREIIRLSGNERDERGRFRDERTDADLAYYEEEFKGESYAKTVLDGRTYESPDPRSMRPIGKIYRAAGLHLLQPAAGGRSEKKIPLVKELLEVHADRKHLVTGEPGAPLLYVSKSCVPLFTSEIEHYVWEEYASGGDQHNPKEHPRKKDDHLMNCLEMAAQIPMRHYPKAATGGRTEAEREDAGGTEKKRVRNRRTGY